MDIIYNLAIGAVKGLATAFIFMHLVKLFKNHPFKKDLYQSIGKYIATRIHPEHRMNMSGETSEVQMLTALMISYLSATLKAAQLTPNKSPYSHIHSFIKCTGNILIMDIKTFNTTHNNPSIARAEKLINDYLDVVFPPVTHNGKLITNYFTIDAIPPELFSVYHAYQAKVISTNWNDQLENYEFDRESKETHLSFTIFIPTPECKRFTSLTR